MRRLVSPQDRGGGATPARGRVLPSILCGVGFVLLFVLAVPAAAGSWRFEAEDVRPFDMYSPGGTGVVACGAASGGQSLQGLAQQGEWVEFGVTFARHTCFIDSIRCASPLRSSWQFLVEFRSEDSPDSVAASNEHPGVTGRSASS